MCERESNPLWDPRGSLSPVVRQTDSVDLGIKFQGSSQTEGTAIGGTQTVNSLLSLITWAAE